MRVIMKADTIKILVVDDELAIRTLIQRFLNQKGYNVIDAQCGKTALEKFASFQPDLVILDVNLPDTTGYSLCEQMQTQRDVFVLMLTSRVIYQIKFKVFLRVQMII